MKNSRKLEIIKIASTIAKQNKCLPSYAQLLKHGITRRTVENYFGNLKELGNLVNKEIGGAEKLLSYKESNKKRSIEEAIKKIYEFSKNTGSMPGFNELKKFGITDRFVEHHFGNLGNLHKEAYKKSSRPNIYNFLEMTEIIKKTNAVTKYIITTAVSGCSVHENFFSALKHFAKHENAELLILPAYSDSRKMGFFDQKLSGSNFVYENLRLNSNLFISNIYISPTQVDPVTGLGRICQREGSFILASPKQRLKVIPVANQKMSHLILSPGAITKPDYRNKSGDVKRTGYIADMDHIIGALVVEILDKDRYHVRHIQAEYQTGNFIDLGYKYTASGQKKWAGSTAIVCGDWHVGDTCPKVKQATIEMAKYLKPKIGVFHDVFNGHSINHHESEDLISKHIRLCQKKLNLSDELDECAKDIDEMSELFDVFVWVKSNHDDFIEKYCRKELYRKDPQNFACAMELSLAMCNGIDPIVFAMKKRMKNFKKIKFLERDEDYVINSIQCGIHGDIGANGIRHPNIAALEQSYGANVSGHSHTPEILRGAYRVGTSTKLKLSYNKGPSSWLNTHCVIYPNGSRQLINIIEGNWGNPIKNKKHEKQENKKKGKI